MEKFDTFNFASPIILYPLSYRCKTMAVGRPFQAAFPGAKPSLLRFRKILPPAFGTLDFMRPKKTAWKGRCVEGLRDVC